MMKMNIAYRSVIKKLLALTLALIMVCGMGVAAHAETVTKDLVTLDSPMNLAISVTYTDNGSGQAPEIAFVAPGGQVYQKGMPEEEMTFEQADDTLYFYIPEAEAGNWMIRFDDSFSGHLEVTTAPYSRDVVIEKFVADEITDNYAHVHFLTAFPVDKGFDYVVNAVVLDADGTISGTKELQNGWGYTNEMVEASVPLYELATYSEYLLQLVVYVDEYGIEVSSSAMTDPFGFTNPDTPGMIDDFYITLNRTTGDLQIDWTDAAVYNAEKYILAVYSSLDETEPVYTNSFAGDQTTTSILVDPSAEWLRVELSYTRSGYQAVSQIKAVTLRPNDVEFEITTGENTASLQAQISYTVPSGEVELYVFADGETDVKPTKVSGSGSLAFTLSEHDNKVFVAYKPTDFIVILESKEIFVDRKAPILTFFEDLGSVTTKDAVFRVAGMTEAGATVTVNGKQVQINADGSFLIELNLVNGANSFEFISADPAGNLSRRTVLINRSDVAAVVGSDDVQPFWKTWMPLFITAAAALALAVLILCLFGRKKLTAVQTLKRWSVLAWVLSGAGLGVTIWLLIAKVLSSNVVNTKQFFDKVQASVDEAYAALMELQFYDQWFLIALLVTVVLVIISAGLTVAMIIVGKNLNKPPKAPKPPKSPKQPKPKKEKPVAAPAPAPVVEPEPVVIPEPVPVVEPAPMPVTPKFCSNCGQRCVEGASFCANCGHKLRSLFF